MHWNTENLMNWNLSCPRLLELDELEPLLPKTLGICSSFNVADKMVLTCLRIVVCHASFMLKSTNSWKPTWLRTVEYPASLTIHHLRQKNWKEDNQLISIMDVKEKVKINNHDKL